MVEEGEGEGDAKCKLQYMYRERMFREDAGNRDL